MFPSIVRFPLLMLRKVYNNMTLITKPQDFRSFTRTHEENRSVTWNIWMILWKCKQHIKLLARHWQSKHQREDDRKPNLLRLDNRSAASGAFPILMRLMLVWVAQDSKHSFIFLSKFCFSEIHLYLIMFQVENKINFTVWVFIFASTGTKLSKNRILIPNCFEKL